MNVIASHVNITLHVQTNEAGKTDVSKLEYLLKCTPYPQSPTP